MANVNDTIGQFHRLRVEAAESRLRAIQSQLSLGFTLCAMTKTELCYGRVDNVCTLIEKAQHITATVGRHLDEPNHVPAGRLNDCRGELARLEAQVLSIEEQLKR